LDRIPKVPDGVTVVAVSKTRSADEVEALYRLGHRDFGENYVQELLEKAGELESRGCVGIHWHFIGHLQSNKVRALMPVVHAIHSVDSVRLAREISARAVRSVPCFLEINIAGEPTKAGFAPAEARAAAEEISRLPRIDLRGLMCIPAPQGSAGGLAPGQGARMSFAALRELEKSCRPFTRAELSMGMSEDFEAAIAEGATVVRIGSRIFGPRTSRK